MTAAMLRVSLELVLFAFGCAAQAAAYYCIRIDDHPLLGAGLALVGTDLFLTLWVIL